MNADQEARARLYFFMEIIPTISRELKLDCVKIAIAKWGWI